MGKPIKITINLSKILNTHVVKRVSKKTGEEGYYATFCAFANTRGPMNEHDDSTHYVVQDLWEKGVPKEQQKKGKILGNMSIPKDQHGPAPTQQQQTPANQPARPSGPPSGPPKPGQAPSWA